MFGIGAFVCCRWDLIEPQSSTLEFDVGEFSIIDGFSLPQQGRLQHLGSSEQLFALLQCATVGLVTVSITVDGPDGIARQGLWRILATSAPLHR